MEIREGSQMDHIIKCVNGPFAKKVFSTADVSMFLYEKYGYAEDSIRSEVTKLYNDDPGILLRKAFYKKKKAKNGIKTFHYLYCLKGNFNLFKKVKLERVTGNGSVIYVSRKIGVKPGTVRIGSAMDHIIKCINGPFADKVFSTDDIADFLYEKYGFRKTSIKGLVAKYHEKSPAGTLIRKGYYKKIDTVDFPVFHFLYCTKGNNKLFKDVKLKKAKGGGNRW
jgi:hypothetical protein